MSSSRKPDNFLKLEIGKMCRIEYAKEDGTIAMYDVIPMHIFHEKQKGFAKWMLHTFTMKKYPGLGVEDINDYRSFELAKARVVTI